MHGRPRNSQSLFRTVLSPTPYGLPFPKIGGSQPFRPPDPLTHLDTPNYQILKNILQIVETVI